MSKYTRHADHLTTMIRVALMLSLVIAGSSQARQRPAPVIEGSSQTYSAVSTRSYDQSTLSIEERLASIERRLENQTLVEMITRLDNVQQEMQRLVGEIEVLNHQIGGIKKRQRDLYLDVDRRIGQIERNKGTSNNQLSSRAPYSSITSSTGGIGSNVIPSARASSMVNTPGGSRQSYNTAAGNSKIASKAYERAFNLLRDGRYDLAIVSFKAYLDTYPRAGYADNAQYWLGEANYANQHYEVALTEFNRVLDNYPKSKKVPDAMLKIGYSYGELGKGQQAQDVLNNIISVFPDSTAARLAKKRINSLKRRR